MTDRLELFEVSRRTINRDIEDLCKAGIPIVTKQGMNGGISIIENYKFDYTNKDNLITWLLSFGEKAELLEPEEIRKEIKVSIECMKKRYEGEI